MFNCGMSGNQFMYGQQSQQPQGAGNNIVWVQGMAGAKAYPVAPGAAVWMMDSEEKQFYVRSVDRLRELGDSQGIDLDTKPKFWRFLPYTRS